VTDDEARRDDMAEPSTDRARLALAAIAETTGEEPIADRYREDQALRMATFTDLDLPTARRVVEVTYHATTLGELMIRMQAMGATSEVAATFRELSRTLREFDKRFGERPGWLG
jgi:hypothetical protein